MSVFDLAALTQEFRSVRSFQIRGKLLATAPETLLGGAFDGYCRPLTAATAECFLAELPHPIPALNRAAVARPLRTGIGAIDAFLPVGAGQRVAVLAEAGVGKSSLLSTMAARSAADVNIVALIGERGREVLEFLERQLPPAMRARTIVIASTSDEPAASRLSAAMLATLLAAEFRKKGNDVLLLVDSVTRVARAIRDIGFEAGEAPVRRGYPASVFSFLPKLVEQAGATPDGSITAFYTVLQSADAEDDPIAEELKSLTDGHIALSSKLAAAGVYPAVDILRSLSRLAPRFQSEKHRAAVALVRRLLMKIEEEKELSLLAGRAEGELAVALRFEREIIGLLRRDDAAELLCPLAERIRRELI